MSDVLHIGVSDAVDVCLPTDFVTSATAIVGQRGTGKSTAARRFVEQVARSGGHAAILDPVGAWWGITHAGSGPGLEGIVIGGEHGDVPLEETGGHLVAELVVARHWPVVVIDLRLLRKGQQLRFMADYCETLFHLNHEALLQVFEEADRIAPQASRSQDVQAMRALGAAEDICKLGRSRGLGALPITQRPASINKNVFEACENTMFFRLKGANDRKAARSWLEANADPDALRVIMGSLATLKVGECWLYTDVIQRVTVAAPETFDSSSTPKVGEAAAAPTARTPVDLDVLRQRMAETIERAAESDPKALRQRIKALEGELAGRVEKAPIISPSCEHETELATLRAGQHVLAGEIANQRDENRRLQTLAGQRAVIIEQYEHRTEAVIEAAHSLRALARPQEAHDANPRTGSAGGDEPARGSGTRHREPGARTAPEAQLPVISAAPEQRNGISGRGMGTLPAQSRPGSVGRRPSTAQGRDTEDMKDEEVDALIERKLVALGMVRTIIVAPAEVIRKDYLRQAIDRLMTDLKELSPDALEAYRLLLSRDSYLTVGQISQVISGYQGGAAQVKWGTATKNLLQAGLVNKGGSGGGGFKASDEEARSRVEKALAPHLATHEEVEEVYQAVLGRLAGGQHAAAVTV